MSTDDTLDFIAVVSCVASLMLGAADAVEQCIDQLKKPKVLLVSASLAFAASFIICIIIKLLMCCQ